MTLILLSSGFGPGPLVPNSNETFYAYVATITLIVGGIASIVCAIVAAWVITLRWREKALDLPTLRDELAAIDARFAAAKIADRAAQAKAERQSGRFGRISRSDQESRVQILEAAQAKRMDREGARFVARSAARAATVRAHGHPILAVLTWVGLVSAAAAWTIAYGVFVAAPKIAAQDHATVLANDKWTGLVSAWAHERYGVTSGVKEWTNTNDLLPAGTYGGNVIAQGHAVFVKLVFVEGQPALMTQPGNGTELPLVDGSY